MPVYCAELTAFACYRAENDSAACRQSATACCTVALRTALRPMAPKCTVSVVVPSAVASPKQTMPSGFCAVPPGPATPVTATAISASERRNAPSAMARATVSDTAPCVLMACASTPSICVLAALEYVTNPRSNIAELPGISVMRQRSYQHDVVERG